MPTDDVLDLLFEADDPASPKARKLEAKALSMKRGEHPRAVLLAMAGDYYRFRKDYESARRCLARRGDIGPHTCHAVGDSFAEQDRMTEALRWFTIPFTWTDPNDLDGLEHDCLEARYQLRRDLFLDHDRYDLAMEAIWDWPSSQES